MLVAIGDIINIWHFLLKPLLHGGHVLKMRFGIVPYIYGMIQRLHGMQAAGNHGITGIPKTNRHILVCLLIIDILILWLAVHYPQAAAAIYLKTN